MGIGAALFACGGDEGRQAALDKAERWRAVLDEMAEVANVEEMAAIQALLYPVTLHIINERAHRWAESRS